MVTPVTVFESGAQLGSALAAEIADGIALAREEGHLYVLGCPGGRTPRPIYHALVETVRERALPLSNVVVAMMDDYVLLQDDGTFANVEEEMHYSCRRFGSIEIVAALNAVAGSSPIPDANLWVPDAAAPDAYEERLREVGGIDLFLLASGASDGHVAFNPPGSARDSTTRVVTLAPSTKQDNLATFPAFSGVGAVPDYGVTVGINTIAELSKALVMILIGSDKTTAFRELTAAEGYDPHWPATVIAAREDGRIYADRAAAGKAAS